jgi:predicted transposase YbfD/YdcC
MDKPPAITIAEHFSTLCDPRVDRTKDPLLTDILTIAICAVISGADTWVAIERFGNAKYDGFKSFLPLPNGIPSHDTFGRVFAALEPTAFSECFSAWMASVTQLTQGQVVAIDGKTLRGSFDTASAKAAIHMVSAWACSNHLLLGQIKTDEKSNEITAIPHLLKMLHLHGCLVTIDAMGCQKAIAKAIIDQGADYVLALKANHATFFEEVRDFLDERIGHGSGPFAHACYETLDADHGRIERRRIWSTCAVDWFEARDQWAGLNSFIVVEAQRTRGEHTRVERRYYISSLSGEDAQPLAGAVRAHWAIENNLHWMLDVAFAEDACRVRQGHADENFATLRRIGLHLLKQEKTAKVGIPTKRLMAGWDSKYLLKVLSG